MFDLPTALSVPVRKASSKRTPPPIPKRRSIGECIPDQSATRRQSSLDSGPEIKVRPQLVREPCLTPTILLPSSQNVGQTVSQTVVNRQSPVPVLPAPPSGKRTNSRKDRKRPAFMEKSTFERNSMTSSINSSNSKSIGERIFPLSLG